MFFSSEKIIITFSHTTLTVSKITLGSNPKERILTTISWNEKQLPLILKKIKTSIGKNVRILLSEDLTYITALTLPAESELTRDFILQKAQEIIPDDIKTTTWDYKIIPQDSTKKKEIIILVAALVKSYQQSLYPSLEQSGLAIEGIEPISYALARFSQYVSVPLVIYHQTDSALLVLANKGELLHTHTYTLAPLQENIHHFLEECSRKYPITVQKIIVSSKTSIQAPSTIQGIKTEIQLLNPSISLAYKKDLNRGKNTNLNLQIFSVTETNHNKEDNGDDTSTVRKTKKYFIPLTIFAVVIIPSIAFLGYYYGFFTTQSIKKETPKEIIAKTPTPSITKIPTNITPTIVASTSAFTISVLNGTPETGIAQELADTLTERGYTITTTGNANTPTYTMTEIHYKSSVTNDFKMGLDKLIKNIYDNYEERKSEENQQTDILIIIGKNE